MMKWCPAAIHSRRVARERRKQIRLRSDYSDYSDWAPCHNHDWVPISCILWTYQKGYRLNQARRHDGHQAKATG